MLISSLSPSSSSRPPLGLLQKRSVREQLYRAFVTRAGETNAPLIDKILTLRREQAQLLGFATHAEVSLTRKMAGSVEAVAELTEMLRAKALPAAKQVWRGSRFAAGPT